GRRRDARRAIGFHYDVSNDFYRLWLDREMVYSCAYFEDAAHDLDQAQQAKLEHLCRKLRLAPGQRLLDIGCGWGALIVHAARRHGVCAHGITLSRNQYEHVQARIAREGLAGRVTVALKDYAELDGSAVYDRIVSVGMFEHVGLERLPRYFDTARRLLAPGGVFLNHGITQSGEGWGRTVGTSFINRYVFPGGELDSVSNVQRVMERRGFEILDVEALRPHYALTLRAWVNRLRAAEAEALRLVSPAVYRVWCLYMAACARAFEAGDVGVYRILATPRGDGRWRVPLTRRDLYA
ncbi:class I SAM-dependent methyltransferase, partial [Pseudomonas aeruginosa]|nr:class I SAM-dependent methyltransferase [Pseudomonas aeruginosa]